MKVIQLGCGAVGLVCAQHLLKSDKIERLLLADMVTDKAEELIKKTGTDKASVQKMDASNKEEMKRIFKDWDLIINSAIPQFNIDIMTAAYESGINYMDYAMGDDDQYVLDSKFKDAGVGALISMGEDPGMTDIFAMHASKMLDEVEEVRVRDGDNAIVEGYNFIGLFSPDTFIDEVLLDPVIFRNGEWIKDKPFSGEEKYVFPDPIGPMTVYNVDHEESLLIPKHINKGLKNCDFKIVLDPDFVRIVKSLNEVGLTSWEPINVKGQMVRPRDVVTALMPRPADLAGKVKGYGCVIVEMTGKKDGINKRVKTWTMMSHERAYDISGMHATGYLVGTPGALATIMWAEGKIKEIGVFAPEKLDSEEFVKRLPDYDIIVEETIEDT